MTPVEGLDGIDLKSISPGSMIDVETKSRHYHIECLGGNTMRISGHPRFCPAPVFAQLQGSVGGEGRFDEGQITRGKHLIFILDRQTPVTTSKVVNVHVDRPFEPPVN